jgi:hypothetical protein
MSQGVGLGELRRTRYRGLAKTRLLHILIATALNVFCVSRHGSPNGPAPTLAAPLLPN